MVQSNQNVSALKHRPSTFSEVLAQDHVTQTLKNSLLKNQVANAYLFAGSRGTGKTTTARILAKALNCLNLSPEAEPCCKCDSCLAITRGNHPDVMEIDAASNTGVDNIRELREITRFTPSMSKYKVFIIDEVHMLSKSAENAFLKTLEEPPEHCRFIMATTELDKILPTILSRCQRYQMRRIPTKIIVDHLRRIIQEQDVVELAEPEELDRILYLIARAAEGGLRDALFSLDQLMAFCAGRLNLAEVEEILGAIQFDLIDKFIRSILSDDTASILNVINSIVNQGRDVGVFFKECMQMLRNLAVVKTTQNHQELLDLPDDYIKQLCETAKLTSIEQLLYITDMFWDTELRIRNSPMARLILEMTSIKAAKAGQAVKLEGLIEKLSQGGTINLAAALPVQTAQSPVSAPPVTAQIQPDVFPAPTPPAPLLNPDVPQTEMAPPELDVAPSGSNEPVADAPPAPIPIVGSLETIWAQFLREIEEPEPMLSAALHDSVPLELTDDLIVVAIPSSESFNMRYLTNPSYVKTLQKRLTDSFGKPLKIRVELRDHLSSTLPAAESPVPPNVGTPQPAPEPSTVPVIPKAVESPQDIASKKQEMHKFLGNDERFTKLQDELPGSIKELRPGAS